MAKRTAFFRLAVTVLAVALLLSGCSYNQTGIETLLKPPKLSDEQNKIYAALENSVASTAKGNIKLVYPRKGDFTSAFVKYNLDSESTQETIVFYEVANSATATMPIRINVLDQQNGEWVSVSDVATVSGANEVEKVYFISIQQKVYVAVGFNLSGAATEKALVIYSFEEGMLREKYSAKCTNFEVIDLNDDKEPEVIVIRKDENESKTVRAELRRITEHGDTILLSSAELDPNVTEYKHIIRGKLKDGRSALYLDGLRGANTYTTEILACRGRQIENLMYKGPEADNLIEKTVRTSGILPIDLDGDGVVEIPVRVAAPGYEEAEKHQQEFLTQWYVYDTEVVSIDAPVPDSPAMAVEKGILSLAETTYVVGTLGYIFVLPENWLSQVSVEYVSTDRELIFYEFDSIQGRERNVLSIKAVDNANYQKDAVSKGYTLLKDQGQILYTYRLGPGASSVGASAELVQSNFLLHKLQ